MCYTPSLIVRVASGVPSAFTSRLLEGLAYDAPFSRTPVAHLFVTSLTILLFAGSAWSANYKVLYNFNSTNADPASGLITDAAGNAYGVTSGGGNSSSGTVYELSPTTGYHLLYKFSKSGPGGREPQGNLVFDSAGNLYGTTVSGGTNRTSCGTGGCGVVFELSPPASGVGLWTETVLYSFCSQPNCVDGASPHAGVTFDSEGNLYGTTYNGGNPSCQSEGNGCGTVFELSPSLVGWVEVVIVEFSSVVGSLPNGNLVFDTLGDLYGTTSFGGNENGGTVFSLSSSANGWVLNTLYNFNATPGSTDGTGPLAGVTFDGNGNLYSTTGAGGTSRFGTVFELTPDPGGWTETIIYNFAGGDDGSLPKSSLIIDGSGNLYGTTFAGGGSKGCLQSGCGTVFRLANQADKWVETLFKFPIDGHLGKQPSAPLFMSGVGTIYGTATAGGMQDQGVMFRLVQ